MRRGLAALCFAAEVPACPLQAEKAQYVALSMAAHALLRGGTELKIFLKRL